MRTRTAHLTRLALLLTVVATMAIRIPAPRTGGYINLGDSVIYVTALLFGPPEGLVVGGVGSALADLLGGYAVFAPFTLIIKGAEGFVVGSLARPGFRGQAPPSRMNVASAVLAICAGGALMVAGYFIAEAYVLRLRIGAAATEVPGNIFQSAGRTLTEPSRARIGGPRASPRQDRSLGWKRVGADLSHPSGHGEGHPDRQGITESRPHLLHSRGAHGDESR